LQLEEQIHVPGVADGQLFTTFWHF
jgi:hypothetical protein